MSLRPSLLLAAALAACAATQPGVAPAANPVQRCVAADGRTIYTDRPCTSLGATSRLPGRHAGTAGGARLHRIGCARTVAALSGEVAMAVRSRDVNRLASVYDWAGVSNASARRILDRLEAVASRPLVDIVPVLASEPPQATGHVDVVVAAAPPAQGAPDAVPGPARSNWRTQWIPSAPGQATQGADSTEAATAYADRMATPVPAPRPRPPRPVGLRLEQTLAGTATPSRTVFGLRRNFGCLWISL